MAIYKSDIRFNVEALISIARTTERPQLREALLDEAIDILRNREIQERDLSALDVFTSCFVPSRESRMRTTAVYEKYASVAAEYGCKVMGKQHFYEALKEKGYRFSALHGYPVIYIEYISKED